MSEPTTDPQNPPPGQNDPKPEPGSAGGGEDLAATLKALRSKLDSVYKERNELLKRFGDLDPEAARAALQAQADREKADAEKKGEWERLRTKLAEEHGKALEKERATAARLRSSLERQIVRAEAVRAIAAAKGDPDLLLPHVLASVEVVEEGDEFVARVLDPKERGKHRFNSKGEYMTISELVTADLRERFPRAFEGSGTGGSGATGSAGSEGGGAVVLTRDQAKDPATYRRAKAEAEQRGVSLRLAS